MPTKSRADEGVTLVQIAAAYPEGPLPGLERGPLPNFSHVIPDVIGILIREFWRGKFEHPDIVRSVRNPPTRREVLADLRRSRPDIISSYVAGFPALKLEGADDETWFAFLGAVLYRDQDEADFIEQVSITRLMFWRWCQRQRMENPGAIDPRWQDAILTWEDAYPLTRPHRRGRGRPREYDYDDIDRELRHLLETRAAAVFRTPSAVVKHLQAIFGNDAPPESTLREHVVTWISRYLPGL